MLKSLDTVDIWWLSRVIEHINLSNLIAFILRTVKEPVPRQQLHPLDIASSRGQTGRDRNEISLAHQPARLLAFMRNGCHLTAWWPLTRSSVCLISETSGFTIDRKATSSRLTVSRCSCCLKRPLLLLCAASQFCLEKIARLSRCPTRLRQ